MIVRSGAVLSLLGAFLAVSGAPYGGGHDDGEFRDKKYDEQLKQVSKVGNTYVSGGNSIALHKLIELYVSPIGGRTGNLRQPARSGQCPKGGGQLPFQHLQQVRQPAAQSEELFRCKFQLDSNWKWWELKLLHSNRS